MQRESDHADRTSIPAPPVTRDSGYTGKQFEEVTVESVLTNCYGRPTFLECLMPLIDSSVVHFNKRCVDITTANGQRVLHFADGTTHTTDLVIGADGIKSVVRQFVAGDTHLRFTGTVAYRGLIPTEDLKRAGVRTEMSVKPICWVGIDKVHISSFGKRPVL